MLDHGFSTAYSRIYFLLEEALIYLLLEEVLIETFKIHNLFIQYPNNTYFSVLESS